MTALSPKEELPFVLSAIYLKRSLLLFQKLVLYSEDAESDTSVRHYDYQCEGLEILEGFSRKKKQSLLMKAFNLIKITPFANIRIIPYSDRKAANGTTKRTFLNTTFSNSENSPSKMTAIKYLRPNKVDNDENFLGKSNVQGTSTKLQQLLTRIKSVNNGDRQKIKTERGPVRDNATLYMDSSRLKPVSVGELYLYQPSSMKHRQDYLTSQQMSSKSSRRQFIMEKFRHIESSLSQLRQGEHATTTEGLGSQILKQIQTLRQKLNFKTKNTFNSFKA